MEVKLIANGDTDINALISALEENGFKTGVVVVAARAGCEHSPLAGVCCRECRIVRLQQRYAEDEAQLQRTSYELREAIIHGCN